jgi:DNA-binding MarR family transcriptional regulator
MKPMESTSYLMQHVASVLQRQTDQVLQERLGIGMSQFRILLMLHEHVDEHAPVDQRRVADNLGQTEASISRQVKLLQELGMVVATVDPRERRRRLLTPTVKGLKVLHAAEDVLEQYEEPMLAAFNDKQRAQLREALMLLHEYSCAPGKPMACDRAHDITALYAGHNAL